MKEYVKVLTVNVPAAIATYNSSKNSENEGRKTFWETINIGGKFCFHFILANHSKIDPVEESCEVERFCKLPMLSTQTDIVKWWCGQKEQYPTLHLLAMNYLRIPSSSVPAERINSVAVRIFEHRERLHDATFKAEMCASSWIKMLKKLNIDIPRNPKKYLEENNIDISKIQNDDIVIEYLCKQS